VFSSIATSIPPKAAKQACASSADANSCSKNSENLALFSGVASAVVAFKLKAVRNEGSAANAAINSRTTTAR